MFTQLCENLEGSVGEAPNDLRSKLAAIAQTYIDYAAMHPMLFTYMFEAKRMEGVHQVRAVSAQAIGVATRVLCEEQACREADERTVEQLGLTLFGATHGFTALTASSLVPKDTIDESLKQPPNILWEGMPLA